MKYLKTYQGVVTGSMAGRDDGYPETKYRYYHDMKSLAKDYGKEKGEIYYELKPMMKEQLENQVYLALEDLKEDKKEKKKADIQDKIVELQKQLEKLN